MTIDEIISTTVQYMAALPDGTEISTSKALDDACGFGFDPNGEYLVGGRAIDFDGMFALDRDIRKAARRLGLIIDDSIYSGMVGGLLFHVPYLVFKRKR